jgi:hypothetical protein
MRRLLLTLALAALAGCHSGELSQINSQSLLQANNYRVIQVGVKGQDSGFRVFGFGGSAQYSTCMDKIRVLAELDGRSRALVNVTTDRSLWSIGIVGGDSLTITADVVEFTGPPTGGQ